MGALAVHRKRALLALLATFSVGVAWAGPETGRASAAAHYEVDRAMCLRGESSQDLDTCLREAGAAYAQARLGGRPDEQADFDANRLQRCAPLPADQRSDCIARMQGQGTTQGSVAGGGIYRELATPVDDAGPPQR